MTTSLKSNILNWVIRILFVIIAIIVIGLILLNLISGGGESQRRGLEQAFSENFGVPMTMRTLNKFNAFPQFIIDASDISSAPNEKNRLIKADQVAIAFSLWDLLQNKKTIQELTIKNGEILIPEFSPHHFTQIETSIITPTIDNRQAKLQASAMVKGKKLNLSIPLEHKKSGIHFNYSIVQPTLITARYGTCDISGNIKANNVFEWDQKNKKNNDCNEFLKLLAP